MTLNSNWTVSYIKKNSSDLTSPKLRYAVYYDKSNNVPVELYLVFLNGRTEWIEKYSCLPEQLQLPKGVAFLTWDHRGQGASEGHRAHIDSYDDFVEDAKLIIDEVVSEKPYAILAHSMGGLISLYGTMKGVFNPQRLLLSSPLFLMPSGKISRFAVRVVSTIAVHLGFAQKRPWVVGEDSFSDYEHNNLTHSKAMFDLIKNSPYPIPFPSFGWITASFKATDFIFDKHNMEKFNTPLLVLSAQKDKIVDVSGHSLWVNRKNRQERQNFLYKVETINDAYHELFIESESYLDQALSFTKQWFKNL